MEFSRSVEEEVLEDFQEEVFVEGEESERSGHGGEGENLEKS